MATPPSFLLVFVPRNGLDWMFTFVDSGCFLSKSMPVLTPHYHGPWRKALFSVLIGPDVGAFPSLMLHVSISLTPSRLVT